MSLQRIFNVARKLGTPIIMTDAAGLEPLVILPLDQFEAMAGVTSDGEVKISPPIVQNEMEEIPLEDTFYLEPVDQEEGI